jgi:hypothetical protein
MVRVPGATAIVSSVLAAVACQRRREPPPAPPVLAPGEVPAVTAPIAIDGELHEPDWNIRARVSPFLAAAGGEARPYSQIRLLRDDATLYVGLYAADQDLRSSDAFELTLGALRLAIDPRGRITPPEAGARAAADVDESLDDPGDEDEEWVIELALPISAIPTGVTTLHAARCDTPKDGKPRCGAWDGPLVLAPRPR